MTISIFERLLLTGNANALEVAGLPEAAQIARGDYTNFTSDAPNEKAAQIAFECITCTDTPITPPKSLTSALRAATSGSKDDLYAVYIAGVGLLQAFLSVNWAGPPISPNSTESDTAKESSAALLLASGGEDVARPARKLAWLRAAHRILVDSVAELVRCGAQLVPWWAARALLAHQGVLSGLAPELRYSVFTMFGRFLGADAAMARDLFAGDNVATSSDVEGGEEEDEWLLPAPAADNGEICDEESDFVQVLDSQNGTDRQLLSLAYLELALAQKLYYDGDGALVSLRKASEMANVVFRVAGEMGVRMKHQTKPTAQLVARAFELGNPEEVGVVRDEEEGFAVRFPRCHTVRPDGTPIEMDGGVHIDLPLPKNVPVDDTDVLGYIQLTEDKASEITASENESSSDDEGDDVILGGEIEYLTPMRQALALGEAAIVRARNASHVLTREEMAPYVNLVLSNAQSPFGTTSIVQIRALMLRVTFERERGRFLERCMSQMEEIGKFVESSMESATIQCRQAATVERNFFLFASSVPPRWELQKELAISFGKIGLVKSAMEIFEKLEFWEELVDCHRLIGNLGAAESLVRDQLEMLDRAVLEDGVMTESEIASNVLQFGSKGAVHARAARRPRLLCVLGDVTRNKEHFETAWEESGRKYARAKRALGRMCVEKGEWEAAVVHFKDALAINSLFPDVWFTYGCAAIETHDMQLAAHAFTRVVQQVPENGEAWNNLGRVLHELGKQKEALNALMEAAKTKRDSWRIWNNVLMLATELRSSADIVRAMERLLELRGKDGVEAASLGVAVAEVIRMTSSDDIEDKALVGPVCRKLLKVLGRCTALVSTNPSVWAAYAELHELVPAAGGAQKAFDCRLKQVRAIVAHAEWKSDRRAFRQMVVASDALARLAIRTENELNIRAARLHIKNSIHKTSADFQNDEAFLRLQEVEQLLNANPTYN